MVAVLFCFSFSSLSPLLCVYVSLIGLNIVRYEGLLPNQKVWCMGKTVPSYRMALEDEIERWKGFAKALRIEDKEAFDALMDACRNLASAGSNATQPIIFEPMVMSILLSLQKKTMMLEKELSALKQR
jgi:hypothetical protein